MKILVLSQYWFPENGVPQRRWSWLTEILTNANHEVQVIAPPPHYKRKITFKKWMREALQARPGLTEVGASGETIVRSGFFPATNSLSSRILNQAVVAVSMAYAAIKWDRQNKGSRPEVVVGTVPALPTAVVTWFLSRYLRVPYVIDLRDAWPDLIHEHQKWNDSVGPPSFRERVFRKGPFQLLLRATESVLSGVLKTANGIMTTSTELEASLQEHMLAHNTPTATIRNVFPGESAYVRARTTRSPVGPEKRLNVLYAGTVGRGQDLSNALEACQIAREEGIDIHLRVIGDGAAWVSLSQLAQELEFDVEFMHQVPAASLDEHYEWADTGLVHLADWRSLRRAVPSKTYELMERRIHITGVVDGETAELIQSLKAGHVVLPGDPRALANLWGKLSRNRYELEVGNIAGEWVKALRDDESPKVFLNFLDEVLEISGSKAKKHASK